MKKIFLSLFFFLAILSIASTQPQGKVKIQLTEKSIVKDSSGKVYSRDEWYLLISTGSCIIKPVDLTDANTEFTLTRLTEEQRQQRMNNTPKPAESNYFKTGEIIAGFKTKDINGNKINLEELKGKVIVINFWFINCLPCRQEIPELNEVVKEYKDSTNVVFIAIALDEKSDLKDFLEKKPFDYSIVPDGRSISDIYGVKSYPTHLIIDKEGKVYFHTSGYGVITVNWVRKSIEKLLESSN
jgi:thiol-disulfide isomerase/thioredoxin